MKTVIKTVFGTALVIGVMLLNAFTISMLWYWFVVPFGMPQIPVMVAVGLILLYNRITFKIPIDWDLGSAPKGDEAWVNSIARSTASLMLSASALLFGWLAMLMM